LSLARSRCLSLSGSLHCLQRLSLVVDGSGQCLRFSEFSAMSLSFGPAYPVALLTIASGANVIPTR
jgi:hypothetical protein